MLVVFLVAEGLPPVPLHIVDNGDGSYACSYPSIKKAGTYVLTPTVEGENVKGSPFTVNVESGGFSLEDTSVDFPADWVAGLPGPVISVCDSEGNLRAGGGDTVRARLAHLDEMDLKAKRKDDGAFTVAFPPASRGEYQCNVRVNQKQVPGGPWKIEVAEKPLEPAHVQALAVLAPHSQAVFRKLLENCTAEERVKVLRELAKLAGNNFSSSSSSD